jgi:hypothetical protein
MTSVINENENLFPPAIPTVEERANELQLIHPDSIEENIQTLPVAPDIPASVPQHDTLSEREIISESVPRNHNHVREEFIPGKFEYIKDSWSREMFINAWQAITLTETWDFVKQDIESFMWSDDPRVKIIYNKIEELGYMGHSGASFGCTMRTMQYIAKYGEKKFMEEQIAQNQ